MVLSMTGYGRKEAEQNGLRIVVEMRSVNHRFCEIMVRVPKHWATLEERVKKTVASCVRRGRVDVSIFIEQLHTPSTSFQVDWDLAEQYVQAARQMNVQFSLKEPLQAKDLFMLPGVISFEEAALPDPAEIEEELVRIVQEACHDMAAMRKAEGEQLHDDLCKRLGNIQLWTDEIKEMAPLVVEEYRKKLQQRVADLTKQVAVDEQRLLQEIALFAERVNITEETTRLHSHCTQFMEQLGRPEAVGRKLDFLLQEMNREANTIASKANHLPIQRLAVEIKTELEKMREQVQNIE